MSLLFHHGDTVHTSQQRGERARTLARLVPALKTLNEHVLSLDLGDFNGWALIEREKGDDAICSNGYGLCLYEHPHEVRKVLGLWKPSEDKREMLPDEKRVDCRIGVRPVRVGWRLEGGFEFRGPVVRMTDFMRNL